MGDALLAVANACRRYLRLADDPPGEPRRAASDSLSAAANTCAAWSRPGVRLNRSSGPLTQIAAITRPPFHAIDLIPPEDADPTVPSTFIVRPIGQLRANPAPHGLAINLAASSLANTRFRQTLLSMLADAASDARQLWLEVGESGALRHLTAFREFCRDARAGGCRVGLEHFGNRFSQVGSLHDLALDYIKVDASFIGGITSNRGNQAFLKGLTTIAHALDWQVFAEGVATADELSAVADLGFDGATGPAVLAPAANPQWD